MKTSGLGAIVDCAAILIAGRSHSRLILLAINLIGGELSLGGFVKKVGLASMRGVLFVDLGQNRTSLTKPTNAASARGRSGSATCNSSARSFRLIPVRHFGVDDHVSIDLPWNHSLGTGLHDSRSALLEALDRRQRRVAMTDQLRGHVGGISQ